MLPEHHPPPSPPGRGGRHFAGSRGGPLLVPSCRGKWVDVREILPQEAAPTPPPSRKQPEVQTGVPIKDGGITLNGLGSAAAYLQGKMYSGASQPDYKLAARYFHIAAQLGHLDAKPEAVKAAVGKRAFTLFFAG